MAEAKVPLIHVVGDVDKVVPVKKNTDVLAKRYSHEMQQLQMRIWTNQLIMAQKPSDLLIAAAMRVMHGKLRETCAALIALKQNKHTDEEWRRLDKQRREAVAKLGILSEWQIQHKPGFDRSLTWSV